MELTWHRHSGPEVGAADLYALLRLRCEVFVVEQQCPYPDLDGLDLHPATHHVFATGPGAELLGLARVLGPGVLDADVHVGRVVVSPQGRGRGLGEQVVARAVELGRATWPDARVVLSAQSHLVDWYAGQGFRAVGEAYDEDGIEHRDMVLSG